LLGLTREQVSHIELSVKETDNLRLINNPKHEYKIKSLHVNRFTSFKDCLGHRKKNFTLYIQDDDYYY